MHDQPAILVEHLQACIQDQYNLIITTLEFLPLGLDSNAGVYHIVSQQGDAFLLKVKAGTLYEPACLIPRYLNEQGISSVVAPIPTSSGNLWTQLEKWAVLVYPFIEGDTSWTGMTNEQWKVLGSTFEHIHQVSLPPFGFESLRRETFDPTEYIQWIQAFEAQHTHLQSGASTVEHALHTSWMTHLSTIHTAIATLETLGGILQRQTLPYVICHADLHPANLLRDSSGHVFVIDWDDVILAPKERDFIFIETTPIDDQSELSHFFQGYGEANINWIALTYYRYERAVQDLIECAQEVFFRDDLGARTKADSVQLFHEILAEGGEIDIASQTSAHLPSDLTIPTRMVSGIGRELAKRKQEDSKPQQFAVSDEQDGHNG